MSTKRLLALAALLMIVVPFLVFGHPFTTTAVVLVALSELV